MRYHLKKIRTLLLCCILLFTLSSAQAAINPNMALRIYDIYSEKFYKAYNDKNIPAAKIAYKNITRYLKIIKELEYSPNINRKQKRQIKIRLSKYSKLDSTYKEFKIKPAKTPPNKYTLGVDYNSSVGSFYNGSIEWHPEFLKKYQVENKSRIRLSDSRMDTFSLISNSTFTYNSLPSVFDLSMFVDNKNSNNSNFELGYGFDSKVDLWGMKNSDLNSYLLLHSQKKNSSGRLSFKYTPVYNNGIINTTYTLNLSETKNSGYHELFSSYSGKKMNLLGYTHKQMASARLSLFPELKTLNTFYLQWNSRFNQDNHKLSSQLNYNYMPNNKSSSYLGFNNKLNLMQKFWYLENSSIRYDYKTSTNKALRYYRLGSSSNFPILQTQNTKYDGSAGIDFFEYHISTSRYSVIYFQLNALETTEKALLPNYNLRLGRRNYPKNNNSAWSFDASSSNDFMVFDNTKVDGMYSINLVKFDKTSKIQSDSMSLSSAFSHRNSLFEKEDLSFNSNIAWIVYFQNKSATSLVLTISSSLLF